MYADALVIVAEDCEELFAKLEIWKVSMKSKGL